jgi:hypothetical protein
MRHVASHRPATALLAGAELPVSATEVRRVREILSRAKPDAEGQACPIHSFIPPALTNRLTSLARALGVVATRLVCRFTSQGLTAQLRTHVDVADMWHEDETGALADACAALAQLQELSAKVNHALRRDWPTPALGAHL